VLNSEYKTVKNASDIQNALNNYKSVMLEANYNYNVTGTIIIPEGKELYIPEGVTINYSGTDCAIKINSNATLRGDGIIQKQLLWNGSNMMPAIRILGSNIKIDFNEIKGFEIGIILGGEIKIENCNIKIRSFADLLRPISIIPIGSGSVNNNHFHLGQSAEHVSGGDRNPLADTLALYGTGIYMSGEPNSNTFSGHIEGYPIGIRLSGAYNNIQSLRFESCKTRIWITGSRTRNNYIFGDFGEIHPQVLTLPGSDGTAVVNETSKSINSLLSIYGWDYRTDVKTLFIKGNHIISDLDLWLASDNKINQMVATNSIMSLNGTNYEIKYEKTNKNGKKDKHYGFIAQELKTVLPDLVSINELDSLYRISYYMLIPILTEAFKMQEDRIMQNMKDIETLKLQNAELLQLIEKTNYAQSKNLKSKELNSSFIDLDNKKILAYPNPSNGYITVKSSEEITNFEIIDASEKF
jgi:hypothetical protein